MGCKFFAPHICIVILGNGVAQMKSFDFSWFLMFLGLFVCKLACVHEFIEYDGFNAFNAKIIRLPHAEIKQARHSNKRSSDFITKLVIVYNETHYGHVICLNQYQSLCDEKHYKKDFYVNNVAFVHTNLAQQTSFLIQGDVYLGQEKMLTIPPMPRETMLAEIKSIRYSQRMASAVWLFMIMLICVVDILLFRAIKSGRLDD